jgi:hypothetical protein
VRKVFVICPVRNVSEQTKKAIRDYVLKLEQSGVLVHWPSRDTNQDDPIGTNICQTNREAIYTSNEIHIWFDSNSEGSLFDIGMTFAFLRNLNKKIVLINRDEISPTPHKSFQNVLLELAKVSS